MDLIVYGYSHPWRTSFKLVHIVINGRALFMHILILGWLSLDVAKSCMTTKDGLHLIDPHHCWYWFLHTTVHTNFIVKSWLHCVKKSMWNKHFPVLYIYIYIYTYKFGLSSWWTLKLVYYFLHKLLNKRFDIWSHVQ